MKGYLRGDMGRSVSTRQPVSDVLWPALGRSAKLALLAFLIVVPLSIVGGVIAALHEGSPRDRVITSAACPPRPCPTSCGRCCC